MKCKQMVVVSLLLSGCAGSPITADEIASAKERLGINRRSSTSDSLATLLRKHTSQRLDINRMSSEQLQNPEVTDDDLFRALAWTDNFDMRLPDAEVLAEVQRRGLLTDRDVSAIKSGTIFVGMSTYALVVLRGRPSHMNNFLDGTSTLFFRGPPKLVVTIRKAKVISWVESPY